MDLKDLPAVVNHDAELVRLKCRLRSRLQRLARQRSYVCCAAAKLKGLMQTYHILDIAQSALLHCR
jgi:hypothetical protein